MQSRVTKAAGNRYCQARLKAAKYNEKLLTRAGAVDYLPGVTEDSLKKYELDITKTPNTVVALMADAYAEPELRAWYCANECPLGKDRIAEISDMPPERCVLRMRRHMDDIQFSCDLGCGVAFRRPLKYHLHIRGNILVRFHTSVCTLAIAVRTDDTLIFPTTHLCVFCTFGFHGHIPAITLANKILESNINPSGITFEISCVKIITDGNKTGVVKRKYPLNKIAGFNAVASKSGKVFYNNTVDLSGLNHC